MGFKEKRLKIFEEKVSVGRLRRVLEEALDEAMTEVDLGLRVILAACLAFNRAPFLGKKGVLACKRACISAYRANE